MASKAYHSQYGEGKVVFLMLLFSVACSVLYFINGWIQSVKEERMGYGREEASDSYEPRRANYTVEYNQ